MNRIHVFYSISSLLLLVAAYIYFIPSVIHPEIIFPGRIDSVSMAFEKYKLQESQLNESSIDSFFAVTPVDYGLEYFEISISADDGEQINAWFLPAEPGSPTVLILHHLSESRINQLGLARQLHDRGIQVCLAELRAHGVSKANEFGLDPAVLTDLKLITDTLLNLNGVRKAAVMGKGLSTYLAMQLAIQDGRFDAMILLCPFNKLNVLLKQMAQKNWPNVYRFYYPVLKRKVDEKLKSNSDLVSLENLSPAIEIPALIISATEDLNYSPFAADAVFKSLASGKKELFLVRGASIDDVENKEGEKYYNRLGEFINKNLPPKSKLKNKKIT